MSKDVGQGSTLLRLQDLGVSYGRLTALQGVNLQVQRGDFIALIGANGSGKTTLLQALHGMVPHSGMRSVASPAPAQVMVFQRPFILRLSVWNNLRVALWLAGVPAAERASRAREA
ncbi:ATP-binding cassette domain-containing protein, partial [Paucibacter sp. XJ19-41]|uniref:ATP-binding cassette domain-containing protein n=1 Tax=Paucibacter sp. XJ19-41 TaxID=2927824 RepID=UPI00234B157C